MKLLLMFVLVTAVTFSYGQEQDTIHFVHGLPITGEDSVAQEPPPDMAPYDDIMRVPSEQVPDALAAEFDKNELLNNWRSAATVEFDRNTNLYWIRFEEAGTIRSYGYNRKGKPVSVRHQSSENVNQKR